jgi:hypothetical protein
MKKTKINISVWFKLQDQLEKGLSDDEILKYWLQTCIRQTSPSVWDQLNLFLIKEIGKKRPPGIGLEYGVS